MPVIRVEGLSKEYAGKRLMDEVSFTVDAGEGVALVGPNGSGKTTLLRMLAGRERPDDGVVDVQARTHWFQQHPEIPTGATVGSLLRAHKPVPPALAAEKEGLEERIADPALYEQPGYEDVLARYAEVERQIKIATAPGNAESDIMRRLGVLDLEQEAASLSGGEKTRVFLARTLQMVRPGDLIILDEPTNHLDVESIEWLEEWIHSFDGTVLLVAHDRAFLDRVATRVLEVRDASVTSYQGNYEDYVASREEEVERQKRDHQKARERVVDAKGTIMQFRHQKRFDGQYASRMKSLEKYQAALQRTPDAVMEKLGFGLQFGAAAKHSEEMVRLTGICKSYQEPVLDGADLEIRKGDRIGLVGGNGAGKSTLLKIMTGRERADAGSVHAAPGVKGIFFGQEHDDLELERTVVEEVLDARESLEERDVKALLGRFRFNPSVDMRRTVSTLSGGERQRLMLLKCVLKPSNLLILDEPTNHLDLWARDVVIDALNAYHGTLLLVSHDRFLLDSVTEETVALDGGGLQRYQGTFTETRDQHRVHAAKKTTLTIQVHKTFTDWSAKLKYYAGKRYEIPIDSLENSRVIRNALGQGWIKEV